MELTWLGHACFRLRTRDAIIVTDPFGGPDSGYAPLSVSADIVTVSHPHPHHARADAVQGEPRVLSGPGEYEIRGAMIWGVRTFRRDPSAEQQRAQNTTYVIQVEDLTVCHLGDLGFPLTADQLTHVKDCDVLLIPVGGHCTIGAAEAAEIVAQVEPKLIVPMHYATPETNGHLQLDGVERFCREMGATEVQAQHRLNVSPSSLPNEPTVALLARR